MHDGRISLDSESGWCTREATTDDNQVGGLTCFFYFFKFFFLHISAVRRDRAGPDTQSVG